MNKIGLGTWVVAAFGALMVLIATVAGISLLNNVQSQSHYVRLYEGVRGSVELGKATSALWQLRYGFPQFLLAIEVGKSKVSEHPAPRLW